MPLLASETDYTRSLNRGKRSGLSLYFKRLKQSLTMSVYLAAGAGPRSQKQIPVPLPVEHVHVTTQRHTLGMLEKTLSTAFEDV